MLEELSPDLMAEAIASVDVVALEGAAKAMSDKELQRALNKAYEVAYRENLLQLLRRSGGSQDVQEVHSHTPLATLGSALVIVVAATQRGINPSTHVTGKVRRDLETMAKEFGAVKKGKLSIMDGFNR